DWTFSKDILPNLTTTNNTGINFFWNFTFDYHNGTVLYNQTTDTYTQYLLWSYWFSDPQSNVSSALAGDSIKINTTLNKRNELASISNIKSHFNNTEYSTYKSGSEYYSNIILPMINTQTTFYYNFSMDVAYGDQTISRNSSTSSITADPIRVVNCSEAGYIPYVRFNYFDEEDPSKEINASMDITMWIWTSSQSENVSYNFSFAPNHTHEICIDPNTSTITAFSIQEYWNEGDVDNSTYPSRNYYLNGATLTNQTTDLNLYLLNSTYASTIGLTVQDIYSDPVPNVIIKAQRYYIGENAYRTVAMARTDSLGEAVTRLRLSTGEKDVFYRFILEKDFEVIKEIDLTKIVETSLLFTVSLEELLPYWQYWDKTGYSCNFNNVSKLLSCEWSDTSGKMVSANLFVRKIELSGYTTICDESSTDTAGLLTCDLSSYSSSDKFEWWLEFTYQDTKYIAIKGLIENAQAQLYGLSGVYTAMLLIIILSFIGLYSPQVSILLSVFGIIITYMLQLMTLTVGAVVGLIIAAAILIYKVS
ncbi:MAG: hypothetical protein ACTSWZ_05210, partial [Candidatus Heimdallarchaeaceae archaeon]